MATVSGIQGHPLEVTVVGCNKLKDTEWISRQDPYVCLEYASTKHRTRTCTDGGRNPTFQDKFVFSMIEGLRELQVTVWNSNTLKFDDFIGSGKIQLNKVLSQGYDDSTWTLQTKSGKSAGEVRLIMHYQNSKDPRKASAQHTPPYHASIPQVPSYSAPPQPVSYPPTSYPPGSSYPPTSAYAQYPQYPYHQPPSAYPSPPSAYPPPPSAYPPPPQASPYPPSPQASAPHYPPGPYSGGHYPRPY
ncbi:hypothetical protein ACFE04_023628 [Oxalis oulophora]